MHERNLNLRSERVRTINETVRLIQMLFLFFLFAFSFWERKEQKEPITFFTHRTLFRIRRGLSCHPSQKNGFDAKESSMMGWHLTPTKRFNASPIFFCDVKQDYRQKRSNNRLTSFYNQHKEEIGIATSIR